MLALIITGSVIGYFVIGAFLTGLIIRFGGGLTGEDNEEAVVAICIIFWPVLFGIVGSGYGLWRLVKVIASEKKG